MDPEKLNQIQDSLTELIGVDTVMLRRSKTQEDEQRGIFTKTILLTQSNFRKTKLAKNQLGIDLIGFNESFFTMVDNLITLTYSAGLAKFILPYCYDIWDVDDSGDSIIIGDDGQSYKIHNPEDLWNFMKTMISYHQNVIKNPKNGKSKTNIEE